MLKVLIGSSVRQDSRILEYFLDSLRDLKTDNLKIDYMFIDDNDEERSSQLLNTFNPLHSRVTVHREQSKREDYVKDHITHRWTENLVQRVARNKNSIIEYCKEEGYNYLLLADSDLLLHPETLRRLIATGKDIISEVFWTQFYSDTTEMPNVWLMDDYKLYAMDRGENVSQEESHRRMQEFLNMLRIPGVYKVGGLGACTLFSREALEKGVNYEEIYNLSFVGEDRHLCIRAAALGFELFADTCYPCFHIYRESNLEQVPHYLQSLRKMKLETSTQLIKSIVKETIEYWLSFDSRTEKEEERYRTSFTAIGWESFKLAVNKQEILGTRNVIRAELFEFNNMNFDEAMDCCDLLLDVRQRGFNNGQRIERAEEIRIEMRYSGEWKIAEYELIKEYADSVQPEYRTEVFKTLTRRIKTSPCKVTLGMLVHNEADRYLQRVLEHAALYVDEAVILDDASTDNTAEICRQCLKDIPSLIHINQDQGFKNEVVLRKQLWNLIIQQNPDWIIILDADEIFEDRMIKNIRELIKVSYVDYYLFRLFDFWDEEHYRDDELWNAHFRHALFMVRYQPDFPYHWHETPLHCGRFPINIVSQMPGATSDLRLKHLGWSNEDDRIRKYQRYMEHDPEGKYGSLAQYQSILDIKPKLKKWNENEYL